MAKAQKCPKCRYGWLMYPRERNLQACMSCQLKAKGISRTWPYPEATYRSEAETYREGIYDDD